MDNTSIPFLRVPGCIQRATTPLLCRMPHTRARVRGCLLMSLHLHSPWQRAEGMGDAAGSSKVCADTEHPSTHPTSPLWCAAGMCHGGAGGKGVLRVTALLRVSCQSFRLRAVIKKLKEEKIYHFPEENCSSNAH